MAVGERPGIGLVEADGGIDIASQLFERVRRARVVGNYSARGMAIGDFNNDGAPDILVAQNDGQPILLKNNSARSNHGLGLRLIGKKSNPDASAHASHG